MADMLTKAGRSSLMARIRSKNSVPELAVRRTLFRLGYRFRLHRRDLPGTPDLVLPAAKTVLFMNGCFWHGHTCRRGQQVPKSNIAFWTAKITNNKKRDRRVKRQLRQSGWRPLVVWECWTRDPQRLESKLRELLEREKGGV
jgi:DNA mismatch endonuclease, patch repair protein